MIFTKCGQGRTSAGDLGAHPFPVRVRNKLYSDSQQFPSKLCLIKYYIKYPGCGFSTKVTHAFLASEI